MTVGHRAPSSTRISRSGHGRTSAPITAACLDSGHALLPKVMGAVADKYDMSRGFIVPLFCFAFVAFYGFNWPKFSHAESLHELKTSGGH